MGGGTARTVSGILDSVAGGSVQTRGITVARVKRGSQPFLSFVQEPHPKLIGLTSCAPCPGDTDSRGEWVCGALFTRLPGETV
jgi:hypothetical protein